MRPGLHDPFRPWRRHPQSNLRVLTLNLCRGGLIRPPRGAQATRASSESARHPAPTQTVFIARFARNPGRMRPGLHDPFRPWLRHPQSNLRVLTLNLCRGGLIRPPRGAQATRASSDPARRPAPTQTVFIARFARNPGRMRPGLHDPFRPWLRHPQSNLRVLTLNLCRGGLIRPPRGAQATRASSDPPHALRSHKQFSLRASRATPDECVRGYTICSFLDDGTRSQICEYSR